MGQVAQSLRPAFAGLNAGDWVDPSGETRDVTVRLAPRVARRRPADLARLPLMVGGGQGAAPATHSARPDRDDTEGVGPAQIQHLNREKVVSVEANVAGRVRSPRCSSGMNATHRQAQVRRDTISRRAAQAQDQADVFIRVFMALGVAIMLMYLILVVQFGSFLDPLAILVSLPLSLIGVVLALLVTGGTINIMSLIGVILLMGIVAKNAILLIDFAKWARGAGRCRCASR